MSKEALISLHSFCKLIFFSLLVLHAGCHQKKDTSSKDIAILWKDGRATGLSIPKHILKNISEDSFQIQVRLVKPGEQPAIAGDYIIHRDEYIFEPLIPFTKGMRYEVLVQNQILAEVEIPRDTAVPRLLSIYPSQDTVPENLLKIYLVFSRPMLEGYSSQYIKLRDHKGDSLPNTFLNIQPELWNTESTILTVWLDPGRIKRDLQPNRLQGPPLITGEQYKLMISAEWPDKEGTLLMQAYTKNFVASVRDTVSPSPEMWKLIVPKNGTTQPLEVDLGEPLDYVLLLNTIWLIDSNGNIVDGSAHIDNEEMKYRFTPVKPWSRGSYKLKIEARLEDLAGNNLNRLFDLDLSSAVALQPAKKVFEKEWRIN